MTAIEIISEALAVLAQCKDSPNMLFVAHLEALARTVPLVVNDPGSRVADLQIQHAAQMVEWCRDYVEGS